MIGRKYILWLVMCVSLTISKGQQVYMFTSFHEPATAGLRLLYSSDGYRWFGIDTVFLKPEIGSKVMRDPSIVRASDGVFHLVWTCGWKGDKGFGYASSKDLLHWSEQKFVPVMEHEPTTVNVWAPEIFYDDVEKQFIIIWASTIPFRFPKGIEDEDNNHRMYYTTTKDFQNFSPAKLFFDPGVSVIDAVIVKEKPGKYVLLWKDNTRPNRNIKVAFSDQALGPYSNSSDAFTSNFAEGPSILKVNNEWLIYFDAYREKKFGAVRTLDFKTFEKVDSEIALPKGHKHGTIFKMPESQLSELLRILVSGQSVNK
jgi:hypothetical protein